MMVLEVIFINAIAVCLNVGLTPHPQFWVLLLRNYLDEAGLKQKFAPLSIVQVEII